MPEMSEEGEQVLKAKVSTSFWQAAHTLQLQQQITLRLKILFKILLPDPEVKNLQGQPYCAAGVVDLLALFRCISCRYCFSTDLTKPELLGAPGRVFTSRQVNIHHHLSHKAAVHFGASSVVQIVQQRSFML